MAKTENRNKLNQWSLATSLGKYSADFDIDVLVPKNVKSLEKVKLVAIPANIKTVYTFDNF